MDTVTLILLGIMPALAIVAGLKDLTSMKIPNWISGLLIVAFFPAALVVGLDPMTVAVNLGIAVLALLVGAGMFALRWIGGGDAKALAAACLWMGLTGLPALLLWTAIVGGGFCLLLLLVRQYYPMVAPAAFRIGWLARLMEPKGDIPYGVAIAIGALIAFPEGDLVVRFLTAR